MHLTFLILLSVAMALDYAAPANGLQARGKVSPRPLSTPQLKPLILDISANELSQFKFWAQYAAAAYCEDNYIGQTGSKLTCWAENCPLVESTDATIVYDFSK